MRLRWLALGCLAVAALSLLLPSTPTYDPYAWIIWGREITELDLDTVEGPSWKPLPVLFTTVFALVGDDLSPDGWLLVARTGAIFGVVLTYRLGTRLGGPAAGAVAAAALAIEDEYARNAALGNSEGVLVALALLALERHLDGHRGQAMAAAYGCALLRPETWPFVGLYGLWLLRTETALRPALVASAVALPVLWFAPEYWGSGDALRASNRARQPLPDSAAFAEFPFVETLRRSSEVLASPVLALAAAGVLIARPRRVALLFAAGAAALLVIVAAMTQIGYSGNLRYVALPAALVCVLAGGGAVAAVRWVRQRTRSTVAAAAVAAAMTAIAVPLLVGPLRTLDRDLRETAREADLYDDLDRAISLAGGAARVRSCGRIYTGPFEVQALAWRLRVHGAAIDLAPYGRGTVFKARLNPLPPFAPEAYPAPRQTRRFLIYQDCSA